ncbi:MAG TPA: serine protease [Thermoanaerobaculia bacterium]|jgi:S1-C subfamily serine protease|nr:serine protease [Thermoanaerobaculia bacterium]
MTSKSGRGTAMLAGLFAAGLAVTLFVYIDVGWTHWLILKDSPSRKGAKTASVDPQQLQKLRQSILNVRAECEGHTEHSGTAFIVKSGFVATAAHIFGEGPQCTGPIHLIDYKGLEHTATLEGLSADDDLALLKMADETLPPLRLANASNYETPNAVVRLVTIGYPLMQEGGSTRDNASISGEGSLSRFMRDRNVFVTSGLNLNPGNSGGPIFVRDDMTVLGIVRAKLPNTVGDGIGFVASIRAFESFFREKTGQDLR